MKTETLQNFMRKDIDWLKPQKALPPIKPRPEHLTRKRIRSLLADVVDIYEEIDGFHVASNIEGYQITERIDRDGIIYALGDGETQAKINNPRPIGYLSLGDASPILFRARYEHC